MALILCLVLANPMHAHVASTNVDCGIGALIAAINTANEDTAPDVLDLSAGCSYEISLPAHAIPIIAADLTINGHGASIMRWYGSQTPQYSLLSVAPNVTLVVRDLGLEHGAAYDISVPKEGVLLLENCTLSTAMKVALDNDGTAIVSNSSISSNLAGIRNGGSLHLADSVVEKSYMWEWDGPGLQNQGEAVLEGVTFDSNDGKNGGAIQNSGTLQVTKSVFAGNNARTGGAIHNIGTLDVTASTFVGNTAKHGGAIYSTGQLSVLDSTFAPGLEENSREANTGDGAAIWNGGVASIVHSTIAGFEAGKNAVLTTENSMTLANTLISNLIPNCSGLLVDGGGNLRWPASDVSCVGTYGDPELEPLGNYGGPTQTLALGPGSAAINAALAASCAETDQRGVARPQGKRCDAGAFELELPGQPVLLGPPDRKTIPHLRAHLRWEGADHSEYYMVIVRQDSSSGKKVVAQRVSLTEYKTPLLQSGHSYYWRVKACSRVGCAKSIERELKVK